MRVLRRPIVFLRVRCSILILLTVTVRCSIPHCVCVCVTHTHTHTHFDGVLCIKHIKCEVISADRHWWKFIGCYSENHLKLCRKNGGLFNFKRGGTCRMITHRPLTCQGKDFHTGRKQHPKFRFDVLIEGLDTGSAFVSCLKAVRYQPRCKSEVFIWGPIRYLACFWVLLLFVCKGVRR